ncbi:hypothetical protein ACFWVF_08665 [Streptomyces sp. NPDC058659]|uniref:hypothetical protein n=1 Tax=unclassified Streptomyces TaxID=2593676 RepID=UPI0036612AF6
MASITRSLRWVASRPSWILDMRHFKWVLLIDCMVFSITGLVDLALVGTAQAATSILRFASAFVNAAAFVQVRKKLGRLSAIGIAQTGYRPWDFPSAIAGQASAIPILLIPIWIELNSGLLDALDILVLGVALLLMVLAIAAVISIVGQPHVLNVTWGLVASILPLVGLLQFWYLTFYRPVHEGPRVNVVPQLHELRHYKGVTHMRGTVTLENVGAGELDVLSAVYTVTGHDVAAARYITKEEASVVLAAPGNVAWRENRHYRGLLKVGRLIRNGGHFTPGQKNETSFVFDVKNDSLKSVRLTVFLYFIMHGSNSLGKFTECKAGFGALDECLEVKLPQESLIRDLLGDRPVARVKFRHHDPKNGIPVPLLEAEFVPTSWWSKGDAAAQVESIDPYRRSRGVTHSVEYRVDP